MLSIRFQTTQNGDYLSSESGIVPRGIILLVKIKKNQILVSIIHNIRCFEFFFFWYISTEFVIKSYCS